MAKNYLMRFVGILFLVLIVVGIIIHSFTTGEATIVSWICAIPFILASPILISVIFAKNSELGLPQNS
ncbi:MULTISPECIES: hypothetical protein [unclassified Acinetobacter]|uniref:hypothetical protein n=1 Tax=unclassified Acinetobacter TaxID=196816 RepID=UPI0029350B18|nr:MULTISPECIES: hypothetical protein [unclassified Acinetobacter]WOE32407.1 hypothetical protein QSG84_04140 [Acinetobacter sp. SAAs470]WOE37881.1 hypothetical protein QSG86_13190 [Acinetobacter sp. SAAs474]